MIALKGSVAYIYDKSVFLKEYCRLTFIFYKSNNRKIVYLSGT